MSWLIRGSLVVGTIILFTSQPTQAASFDGLGLAPGPVIASRTAGGFHYQLQPGAKTIDSLKIINTTGLTKEIRLTAVPATVSDDNRLYCPPTNSLPAASVHFQSDKISVPANTSQLIPFTVTAPTDSGSESNACLIAEGPAKNTNATLSLNSRLAMRLSINTPGTPRIAIQFTKTHVDVTSDTIKVQSSVVNKSNHSLQASARFSMSGWPVYKTRSAGPKLLLPGGTASIVDTPIERPFLGGWYTLRLNATASPTIVNPQRTSVQATAFYKETIFLWPHPIVILSATILVALIAMFLIKKSREKRDSKTAGATFET